MFLQPGTALNFTVDEDSKSIEDYKTLMKRILKRFGYDSQHLETK